MDTWLLKVPPPFQNPRDLKPLAPPPYEIAVTLFRFENQAQSTKMATRMLLKTDSKLALEFLRKPTLARPQLSAPISGLISLNHKSQQSDSGFPFRDFLGINQKLFTGEESVLNVQECFQNNGPTPGEALWVKGRGASRGKIESEDDEDADEIDEGDFDEEGMEDELDDDFDDDVEDDDEGFGSDDEDYRKGSNLRRN